MTRSKTIYKFCLDGLIWWLICRQVINASWETIWGGGGGEGCLPRGFESRPVMALVSLSKTLNHNCFVLRVGRKAVGPVCCVMHVKEPRTLIVKEKGLAPVFLDSRLEHPTGWICARCKSYHYYYYYQTPPPFGYRHVHNCKQPLF